MLKITFSKLFENVFNNAIKVNDFLIIINTVIVLHGESFCRVNIFFFDFIVLESVLYIGEPFIASSKMSLQRSVACKLCHSNCNV